MRNRLLVGGTLAVIVLVSAWAGFGPAAAIAQAAGPQFSIAVAGVPGCDTTRGDAACSLAPGSRFVVDLRLESLPSSAPKYTGIDVRLAYNGVTPQGVPSFDPWPDCAFPAELARPDALLFGCATGIPPGGPSSYTGLVATVAFSCNQSGTVGLVHGKRNTAVTDEMGVVYVESENTETLTINCVAGGAMPPTPTRSKASGPTIAPAGTIEEPTGQVTTNAPASTQATAATITPASGQGKGNGGGGLNGGVIAIIVVIAVAVAGGLGILSWRLLQSRRGTGGGT